MFRPRPDEETDEEKATRVANSMSFWHSLPFARTHDWVPSSMTTDLDVVYGARGSVQPTTQQQGVMDKVKEGEQDTELPWRF